MPAGIGIGLAARVTVPVMMLAVMWLDPFDIASPSRSHIGTQSGTHAGRQAVKMLER
jgi:hypothetical protein